jgi:hypothetical protein
MCIKKKRLGDVTNTNYREKGCDVNWAELAQHRVQYISYCYQEVRTDCRILQAETLTDGDLHDL